MSRYKPMKCKEIIPGCAYVFYTDSQEEITKGELKDYEEFMERAINEIKHLKEARNGRVETVKNLEKQNIALKALINNDDLTMSVTRDCHDPNHNDRWCHTCEARMNGIEEYQSKLKEVIGG